MKSYCDNVFQCFVLVTGKTDLVYEALLKVPHVKVYLKKDIPREYHYTYNNRIMPIVVEAELGYRMCRRKENCDALPLGM